MGHVDFALDTQLFIKINSVYEKLKEHMKLDLCIYEALSYMSVPWQPYLWTWLSITANIHSLAGQIVACL